MMAQDIRLAGNLFSRASENDDHLTRTRLQGRLLQQTQEMLCVLIEILGSNAVAFGSGFTRKRQVAVVALLRIGGRVVVVTAPDWSRIVSLVRRRRA